MSGNYGSWCSELSVQTFGTTQKAANCDAYYCRLGFLMARGQQALLIADEANNNRDKQITSKARADGLSHLSQAVQVLSDYERVLAVSGRCADLRDVKQMLMNIIRGGNIPDQARAATAAWQTALERIAALGQGGPPQPGKYEECLKKYCPECLQTIDLLGVAKDQKCNDCKRKNEKLINECVAGTPSPVGRPVPPPSPAVRTGGSQTPNQVLNPGELEGKWFECGRIHSEARENPQDLAKVARCLNEGPFGPLGREIRIGFMVEFTKNGNQYAGRVARDSPHRYSNREPFWGRAFSYQPSGEVFRLMQTAPGTYQGDIFDGGGACVPGSCNPRWIATRITVEGDVAREIYQLGRVKVFWVRWPPRHQAPTRR